MPSLLGNLARPFLHLTGEAKRLRFLAEYERTQYLSREQLERLQADRLSELLRYANENCPFYRKRFAEAGFDPAQPVADPTEIRGIPPLEKSEIQENLETINARGFSSRDITVDQTGGSTGQPIRFQIDSCRMESRTAAMMRHDRWAGLGFGCRSAVIWGAPRDKAANTLKSRIRRKIIGEILWLDTGNLTEQRMLDFNRQLLRFRPNIFVAYANSIVFLARFYRAHGIQPYSPKSIISSAEVLSPEGRILVEEVFRAPIFNRYGCREVSVIASECEAHSGMHVMSEGLLVEIVRQNRPVSDGDVGEILVTDLLNRAMPLIRYRVGDAARWISSDCACGRGLPRISSLDGRVTDFLTGTDGQMVSGVFIATYVLAQRPSLGRVQLVQEFVGKVTYFIAPASNFNRQEDLSFLEQSTHKYLGTDTEVRFEIVDDLAIESSGKYRYCKSSVDPFATSSPPLM